MTKWIITKSLWMHHFLEANESAIKEEEVRPEEKKKGNKGRNSIPPRGSHWFPRVAVATEKEDDEE